MGGKTGRTGTWGGGLHLQYPGEFNSWRAARSRCTNVKNNEYPRYGGSGIRMCDRWMVSFANFMSDMGPKPSRSHTIERVDQLKGYTPSNCVWATKLEQNINTGTYRNNTSGRKGVYVTKSGKFYAYIGVQGRAISLGTFENFEDAVKAREKAEHHYGYVPRKSIRG